MIEPSLLSDVRRLARHSVLTRSEHGDIVNRALVSFARHQIIAQFIYTSLLYLMCLKLFKESIIRLLLVRVLLLWFSTFGMDKWYTNSIIDIKVDFTILPISITRTHTAAHCERKLEVSSSPILSLSPLLLYSLVYGYTLCLLFLSMVISSSVLFIHHWPTHQHDDASTHTTLPLTYAECLTSFPSIFNGIIVT